MGAMNFDNKWFMSEGLLSHNCGNEATVKFTGSAVAISGYMSTDGGKADVYLDGKKAGEINAYVPAITTDRALFHAFGLENGPHSLRIVTRDDSDERSGGKIVSIQRIIAFKPE